MSDGQTAPEIHLELYVRSLVPRGACECQRTVLRRLQGLADDGAIDSFEVTVWGRGIRPSTAAQTATGKELQQLVESFAEWAQERGLTLRPRFERRSVRSRMADETYDAIYFPAMALAVFQDGDLAFVAPCADGTTVYTVGDVIDAFEVGGADGVDRLDPARLPVGGSTRTVHEATPTDG